MQILALIECIAMALELPPLNINAKDKNVKHHLKYGNKLVYFVLPVPVIQSNKGK